ncbi:MAG: hypothetical protein CSA18_01110 [Deltaproteobacteria bacterium]|nr:MAG: hypothetical protein CSA18_01110 [Deltaproteobacteria bacterium]
MKEILFTNHEKEISQEKDIRNIVLIFGDSYLTETACNNILKILVPEDKKDFFVEKYDGNFKNLPEVCEIVFTYSFFSSKKIVIYENPAFFEKKADNKKICEKIRSQYLSNRLDLAASAMLRLVDKDDDIFTDEWTEKIISEFFEKEDDSSWVKAVVEYGRDNNIKFSGKKDEESFFSDVLDRDFPDDNYLLIISPKIDKKKKIYKKIKEKGIVIDCSLPSGSRKQDRDKFEKTARDIVFRQLEKNNSGKKLKSEALSLLLEYSGDDLRALSGNLNKVLTYSSSKNFISAGDIKKVLERTREDPIFSFTGAVSEKKIKEALFYMHSLFSSGYHPLQILAALTNQINRLLIAKEFLLSDSGKDIFNNGTNYNVFTKVVVPVIENYDKNIESIVNDLVPGKAKLKKDYLLLGGKKSFYPVFLLLKNALNFEISALKKGIISLGEIDLRIKNGADSEKETENFLFQLL